MSALMKPCSWCFLITQTWRWQPPPTISNKHHAIRQLHGLTEWWWIIMETKAGMASSSDWLFSAHGSLGIVSQKSKVTIYICTHCRPFVSSCETSSTMWKKTAFKVEDFWFLCVSWLIYSIIVISYHFSTSKICCFGKLFFSRCLPMMS